MKANLHYQKLPEITQNNDNSTTEIAAPRNALFVPDTDIG